MKLIAAAPLALSSGDLLAGYVGCCTRLFALFVFMFFVFGFALVG
jgi:hypothetical protein